MLYNVTCITPPDEKNSNPSEVVYLFNNQTNEVRDEKGELIDFRSFPAWNNLPVPNAMVKQRPFSATEPIIGKSRRLRKLKIQLGMACNYHCRYCMQAAYRVKDEHYPNGEMIHEFFAKLDRAELQLDRRGMVELWGGEPLVYLKALRILIPMIREKWGDQLVIKLVTNGSLITHEVADFLLENRVMVIISHDGPGFSLRDDKDPIFDPEIKSAWLYLFEKSRAMGIPMAFSAVITPRNADIRTIREFFSKNFSPEVEFGFEGVVTNSGTQDQACHFSQEEASQLGDSVFHALTAEAGKWSALEGRAYELTMHLVNRIPTYTIGARCDSASPDVLVTDLEGRIVSCQNYPAAVYSIGRIDDYEKISNTRFTHWSRRTACKDCALLSLCRGGCPHLTEEELCDCCPNETVFQAAIFSAVWFRLTGRLIVGISPVSPYSGRKASSHKKRISITSANR